MWKNLFSFLRKDDKHNDSQESRDRGKENEARNREVVHNLGGHENRERRKQTAESNRERHMDEQAFQPTARSPFTRRMHSSTGVSDAARESRQTTSLSTTSVMNVSGPLLSTPMLPKIKRVMDLHDSIRQSPASPMTRSRVGRSASLNYGPTHPTRSTPGRLPVVRLQRRPSLNLSGRSMQSPSTVKVAPPDPTLMTLPSASMSPAPRTSPVKQPPLDSQTVISALRERSNRKRSMVTAAEDSVADPEYTQMSKRRRQDSTISTASSVSLPPMPDTLPDLSRQPDFSPLSRLHTVTHKRPSAPRRDSASEVSVDSLPRAKRERKQNNSRILSSLSSLKRMAGDEGTDDASPHQSTGPQPSHKSQRTGLDSVSQSQNASRQPPPGLSPIHQNQHGTDRNASGMLQGTGGDQAVVSQDRRDSVGGEMRAVDDLMQDGQERENGGQPLAVSQVEGQKLVSERKTDKNSSSKETGEQPTNQKKSDRLSWSPRHTPKLQPVVMASAEDVESDRRREEALRIHAMLDFLDDDDDKDSSRGPVMASTTTSFQTSSTAATTTPAATATIAATATRPSLTTSIPSSTTPSLTSLITTTTTKTTTAGANLTGGQSLGSKAPSLGFTSTSSTSAASAPGGVVSKPSTGLGSSSAPSPSMKAGAALAALSELSSLSSVVSPASKPASTAPSLTSAPTLASSLLGNVASTGTGVPSTASSQYTFTPVFGAPTSPPAPASSGAKVDSSSASTGAGLPSTAPPQYTFTPVFGAPTSPPAPSSSGAKVDNPSVSLSGLKAPVASLSGGFQVSSLTSSTNTSSAAGSLTSPFTFGSVAGAGGAAASKPQAPAAQASSAFTFGSAVSAPSAQAGFSFGSAVSNATATAAPAFSLGATATSSALTAGTGTSLTGTSAGGFTLGQSTLVSASAQSSQPKPAFGSGADLSSSFNQGRDSGSSLQPKNLFGAPKVEGAAAMASATGFGLSSSLASGQGSTATTATGFGLPSSLASGQGSTATTATGFGLSSSLASGQGSTATTASGFSFGASTAAPNTGFTFGQQSTTVAPAPQTGGAPSAGLFSFGQASAAGAQKVAPPSGAFSFGQASSTAAPDFGAPAPSMTAAVGFAGSAAPSTAAAGFSFGNSASTNPGSSSLFTFGGGGGGSKAGVFGQANPTPSTQASIFSFGGSTSQTSAAPAFGANQTQPAPAFGAPQAQPAPAFGASQTKPAPAFGASQTQPAPAFGASQKQPVVGFGASQTASTFGASQNQPAPAFGASKTQPAPAFGATQTQAAPAFGSFGSSSSSTSGFNFGGGGGLTTKAASTPSFGSSTQTTGFGGPAPNPAPAFGGSHSASSTPAFGASTNQNSSATPGSTFVFGAGGANPSSSGFNFGAPSGGGGGGGGAGFNFSAAASGGPQFNFGAGGGGQNMFTAGAGPTVPKPRVVANRARRRGTRR